MKKLTAKQEAFCGEYLIDTNATQAAIRAGYSPKTAGSIGEQNLKKLEIKGRIAEMMEELQSARIASATEVLETLTAALRGEMSEEVVVVEGSGEGMSDARTMDKQIGARDRLKAAELLGKRYRLYADRVDLTANIPRVIAGEDELAD